MRKQFSIITITLIFLTSSAFANNLLDYEILELELTGKFEKNPTMRELFYSGFLRHTTNAEGKVYETTIAQHKKSESYSLITLEITEDGRVGATVTSKISYLSSEDFARIVSVELYNAQNDSRISVKARGDISSYYECIGMFAGAMDLFLDMPRLNEYLQNKDKQ